MAILLPRQADTVNVINKDEVTLAPGSKLVVEGVTITDPETGQPVSVSVLKVVSDDEHGRKLQEGESKSKFSASINVHDHYTDICVKFHKFHFKVSVPVHRILEYLFDHQKWKKEHEKDEKNGARLLAESTDKK